MQWTVRVSLWVLSYTVMSMSSSPMLDSRHRSESMAGMNFLSWMA